MARGLTVRSLQRLTAVSLASSLIALMLAAGVYAAAARTGQLPWADGGATAAALDAEELEGEPATTTAVPVTTTSVGPSTSTTSATSTTLGRTTTTRPSSTTSTTSPSQPVIRSTRANYGPLDPQAADIPFSAGRTSWSATANGVTISVRTDKARPKAGEPVRFDIELSSESKACCGLWFLLGDGSIHADKNGWSCPGGGPAGPGRARFTTTHTYNHDGRWTFNVQAITGNCTETAGNASLYGVIEVAPGVSTAQGPTPPTVELGWSGSPPGHDGDPSWVSMTATLKDPDGWILEGRLDWGDGTAVQTYARPRGTCQTTLSGWPTESHWAIFTGEAIHHYAAPGTYTITMTAVSTACDGTSGRQTASSTVTLQVR